MCARPAGIAPSVIPDAVSESDLPKSVNLREVELLKEAPNLALARERINALMRPGVLGVDPAPELIETHISWVILSGPYAFKIKKPVNFGFLDFSKLNSRKLFCAEEIRLNRRLAPDLYLDVLPITLNGNGIQVGGDGDVVEYMVRMKRFDQAAQLDKQLAAGKVKPEDMRAFARRLGSFHERAAVARGPMINTLAENVHTAAMDNVETILRSALLTDEQRRIVEVLARWSELRHAELAPRLQARAQNGMIRECHGDLHLSNLVRLADYSVTAFDCIEFSDELRWIDVLNDAAFLFMDLKERNRPDLAYGFLSAYLERSGDYGDLDVLRYFMVYRSMVRAKVALLTGDIAGVSMEERQRASQRCQDHLALSMRLSSRTRPCLVLMHGLAGAGKSWVSERLAMYLPGIRMRSDLERKRMYGLPLLTASYSAATEGIYTPEANARTYRLLRDNARLMLSAGFNVIVDAAFLQRPNRDMFRELAAELCVDFLILDVKAPMPVMRRRIKKRQLEAADPSDAGLTILDHQVANAKPFGDAEMPDVLGVTSSQNLDVDLVAADIRKRLGRPI